MLTANVMLGKVEECVVDQQLILELDGHVNQNVTLIGSDVTAGLFPGDFVALTGTSVVGGTVQRNASLDHASQSITESCTRGIQDRKVI